MSQMYAIFKKNQKPVLLQCNRNELKRIH